MQRSELHHLLEALYPPVPGDAALYGLQVEGQASIQRVATAVSADLKTIEAAIEGGSQALIVHHGLFWEKAVPPIQGVLRQRLIALLKNEINLWAFHLPMDLHREVGNNWNAAKELHLKELQPFGLYANTFIGVVGEGSATSPLDWKEKLKQYYRNEIRHASGGNRLIQRIAIVSGGGHRSLEEAHAKGCQALVTGLCDEPQWALAAELGVDLFAVGHAASERIGPKALAQWLSQKGIPSQFLADANPF